MDSNRKTIRFGDIENRSLEELLQQALDAAVEMVTRHATRQPPPDYPLNQWHTLLPNNPSQSARFAALFLFTVYEYQSTMDRAERREKSKAIHEVNTMALYMGITASKILDLCGKPVGGISLISTSVENALDAHAKLRDGGRKGADITNKKYVQKQPGYQQEVDRLISEKDMNYTKATDQVGRSFGVTGRTVRAYTTLKKTPKRRPNRK
jgi:hypothetical protein